MKVWRWQVLLPLSAVLAVAPPVHAQRTLQDPHISYVYPAGAQLGTALEVTVGGEYLKGVSEAHISGGGLRVTISKYFRHLSQGQFAGLRNRMSKARDSLAERERKHGRSPDKVFSEAEVIKEAQITDDELAQMADYKKRAAEPKRQLNPQLMEEVTLQVGIDAKAQPGDRELRLITPAGMSNPLNFPLGKLREVRETEPNDQQPDAVIGDALPVVINGQIMPGDVDRFAFTARKGTRLVAIAALRELIPYLADAVPGWFQGVLALYDAKGREVAFASSALGYRQDPVLFYAVPQDGQYVLEIRDALYRGREDFVYRIALGELPYVTSAFPLGGRAGTQVEVDLAGWNLPQDKLAFDVLFDRGRPLRPFTVRQPDGTPSNRVPFAVDMLPECLEQEPNNTPETAQTLTLPIIVNGRIDRPDDVDVFRFEARAREPIVAEVYARRLNSPLDSLLKITDDAGREVALNDDYEDKGAALSTHHADSRIAVALPAAGTYFLHLSDAQRKGGPEYGYRLHVGPPRRDFELRVVPSSVIAPVGATVPITVYVLRRDGFADDIALNLDKPPTGFKLSGAMVPGGQDKIRLTLTVPPNPTPEPLSLQLEGHALSHGSRLTRVAVPAEAMTQAFAYQHLVTAKDWTVAVTGRNAAKPVVQFVRPDRVKLTPGGTTPLLAAVSGKPPAEIRFELSEPPEGVTIESVSPLGPGAASAPAGGPAGVAVLLRADAKKAPPGLKGNLIFHAFAERTPVSTDGTPPGKPQRTPLGTLPALPFEISLTAPPPRRP